MAATAQTPATTPAPSAAPVAAAPPRRHGGDPLVGFNRAMFSFNQTFDRLLFRPLAMVFKAIVPKFVRTGMRHVFSNVGEPLVFANDLLQLRPKRAAQTLARFAINSTVGIGGLLDVAKAAELPHHHNTLGYTLARYGVGPGPYLFLPFVGPTDLRDFVGGQAEGLVLPLGFGTPFDDIEYQVPKALITGLDLRIESDEDFEALLKTAADPYATIRSVFEQNRDAEIAALAGNAAATGTADPLADPLADPAAPAQPGDDLTDPAPPPPAPAAPAADTPADPAPATTPPALSAMLEMSCFSA